MLFQRKINEFTQRKIEHVIARHYQHIFLLRNSGQRQLKVAHCTQSILVAH